MQLHLSRRTVLTALSALVGVQAVGLRGAAALADEVPAADPVAGMANLRVLLGCNESADRIGRAYLALVPEEAEPMVLAGLLGTDEPGFAEHVEALDAAALRATIADRQRADFAASRTVILRGWMLSRTEVRLCALASLLKSGAAVA